jgi:hypothetical protein
MLAEVELVRHHTLAVRCRTFESSKRKAVGERLRAMSCDGLRVAASQPSLRTRLVTAMQKAHPVPKEKVAKSQVDTAYSHVRHAQMEEEAAQRARALEQGDAALAVTVEKLIEHYMS